MKRLISNFINSTHFSSEIGQSKKSPAPQKGVLSTIKAKFTAKPKPINPGMPVYAGILLKECKDLYERRRELKEKVKGQHLYRRSGIDLTLLKEQRSVEKLLYLKLSKILSLINEFGDKRTMHGQPASQAARNELVAYWNENIDRMQKLINPELYEIEKRENVKEIDNLFFQWQQVKNKIDHCVLRPYQRFDTLKKDLHSIAAKLATHVNSFKDAHHEKFKEVAKVATDIEYMHKEAAADYERERWLRDDDVDTSKYLRR
jgi:hypothetical protein